MTDGIGRIFGGNNYGVGGYVPQRKETQEEVAQQPVVQQQREEIDPSKVMDFLNANNIFVTPNKAATAPAELSQEVQDRVVNYMERFEQIYAVIEKEFGAKLAPDVMDMVMDKVMNV